jgi:large subunit ribosomal protein L15
MVKTHKRNKRTRIRGSRSVGMGFRKKKKGHGNKGGHGMSGTMGQKQQKAQRIAKSMGFEKYFGKKGFTSASKARDKKDQINLDDVQANYFQKDGQKIDLKDYKILGEGEGFKAEIHAKSASISAIEKMDKAGGKIIVNQKAEDAKDKKTDMKEKLLAKQVAKKIEDRKK